MHLWCGWTPSGQQPEQSTLLRRCSLGGRRPFAGSDDNLSPALLRRWRTGMEQEHDRAVDQIESGKRGGRRAKQRRTPAGEEAYGSERKQEPGDRSAPAEAGLPAMVRGFTFNGSNLRTTMRNGETWFVASDVCEVLEHSNPRQVVSRLEDDEKGVLSLDTLGGVQKVNVVNESGLYGLIFTSRKPEAKAFRRWVTSEVLPAIRKTGRYANPSEPSEATPASNGTARVDIPGYGRFTITHTPKGTVIQESVFAIHDEMTAIDCRILCHQIKIVEGLWDRYRQMISTVSAHQDGFSFDGLDKSINDCASVAQHHLNFFEQQKQKALE